MVEIKVLIDNFFDKETKNYHEVIRNGEKIALNGKLMYTGDIYSTTKERAKQLSENGLTEIVKKDYKKGVEDNTPSE